MTNNKITELYQPATMTLNNKSQKSMKLELQEQLSSAHKKLASVSRKLEEKNTIIDGLRTDLEHAIQQITLLQDKPHLPVGKSKWIARPLPGINAC